MKLKTPAEIRPESPPIPLPVSGVDWRRNLAALWTAQFATTLGVTAMLPFIAIFLSVDLGLRPGASLAFWTAICAAAAGAGQAIASPLWGIVADRYGRKPMLLRAIIAGGAVLSLSALSRSPVELGALRFGYGALAGPAPIASALVASETPRPRMGWALGVLNSSSSLGSAIGPAIGAWTAAVVGLRWTFAGAGFITLASSVIAAVWVRESKRPRVRSTSAASKPDAPATPFARRTVALVIVAQGLETAIMIGTLPVVTLRFITLAPGHATVVTGLAFTACAMTSAVASLCVSRIARMFGYRRAIGFGAVGLIGTAILMATLPSLPGIFIALAIFGFLNGTVVPSLATMLGLETPRSCTRRFLALAPVPWQSVAPLVHS